MRLLSRDVRVDFVSRHQFKSKKNAHFFVGERRAILRNLVNKHYDEVWDFTCFSRSDVEDVKENLLTSKYFLISSCWVVHLWKGNVANDFKYQLESFSNLNIVSRNYLEGKYSAEKCLLDSTLEFKTNTQTCVIRLPALLGHGDRHHRIGFYLRRLLDSYPVIIPDGPHHQVSLAWIDDVEEALLRFMVSDQASRYPIWEAVAHPRLPLISFLHQLFRGPRSQEVNTSYVARETILRLFPSFFKYEPFAQFEGLDISQSNVFRAVGYQPTPLTQWINKIEELQDKRDYIPQRDAELEFLASL